MGFFREFIRTLLDAGHTVEIATSAVERVPACYREWGCGIYPLSCSRSPLDRGNLRAVKEIRQIAAKGEYDLIHCHTPIAAMCTRFACKGLRKTGLKVFYTAHGFHFYKGAPIKNWLLYYPVEWLCAFWTDVLITINKEDFALAKKHMHAKQVEFIPGVGVDTKKFTPDSLSEAEIQRLRNELNISSESFVLLSAGELNTNKNHRVVIDALNELRNPDIVYLIAGSGNLREANQKLIDKNGLSDTVKLLGRRSDIAELHKISDCFVHPSFREGLPKAPLEAMASALPLISARIRGLLDYTEDGKTGCCVDPGSVEEMKAAITKMYEDPAFREACGKHNVDVVKAYSLEESLRAMNRIYRLFIPMR